MTTPTVAIVGAGLSGLVCARILQRAGIPATVYEADSSPAARQQGGSLDIHDDTGQIALTEAGLFDEFLRNTHPGGEAMRVMDKRAHVFVDWEPVGTNGRPEIDRTVLRQLLVDSLVPGSIRWGSKVVTVRTVDGNHELEFADGSTVRADLVVGADGAWSKVRQVLTAAKPEYTGVTIVEIRLPDAPAKHPAALALVGHGSLFALSDDKYIGGHGGDQIALGLGLRVAEDWVTASNIDWSDPPAVREALMREFPDWAPELIELIRQSDDLVWPRPIYALPIGHRWPHVAGMTLLGDAAHLMSPFAGEGANLALIDGADLARAILTEPDLDSAIVSYETKMFPRAAKSGKGSADGLTMLFNPRSPRKLVAFFRGMILLSTVASPFRRAFAWLRSRS